MTHHVMTERELKKTNYLILKLIGAEDFTKQVLSYIETDVENNPENFTNDDVVEINENHVDSAIESVFEREFGTDVDTPTCLYEYVHENIDWSQIKEFEREAREILVDAIEYQKDPMKFNGMSQRDFL